MTTKYRTKRMEELKAKCQAFDDAWDYWIRYCTNDGGAAMYCLKKLLYAIIDGELDNKVEGKIEAFERDIDSGLMHSIGMLYPTELKRGMYIPSGELLEVIPDSNGNCTEHIDGNLYVRCISEYDDDAYTVFIPVGDDGE